MDNTITKRTLSLQFAAPINKLFFWYAFFMAFPAIVFVQNISVFFFIVIVYQLIQSGYTILSLKFFIPKIALLFAVGATVSTFGSYAVGGSEQFNRALAVLPNYIYWAVLIMIMIQFRYKLDYDIIFKGITYGLLLSVVYYFFFQRFPIVTVIPVFKILTQNTFAFLLICFTPITVFYIKKNHGYVWSWILIFILIVVGFTSGSRSSSVLVPLGAFLSYFLSGNLKIKNIVLTSVFGLLLALTITSDIGKGIVYKLNWETYDLIFSAQETFETDRSYLARRALVDKGLDLFSQHPVSGIGLNNFASTKGVIAGDFQGAKFVIDKGFDVGKSAHNSYLSILAEGGLLLFVPFALMLIALILHFFFNVKKMPPFYRPVFIGILAMSVHLYFISAILNVYAWFLIAMASAMVYRYDSMEKLIVKYIHYLRLSRK